METKSESVEVFRKLNSLSTKSAHFKIGDPSMSVRAIVSPLFAEALNVKKLNKKFERAKKSRSKKSKI